MALPSRFQSHCCNVIILIRFFKMKVPVLIPNVADSKLIVPVPVSPAIFKSSSDAVTCASTYALIDSDDANVVALAVPIESSSINAVTDNEPSLNVPNVKVPDAVIAVVDNVFV